MKKIDPQITESDALEIIRRATVGIATPDTVTSEPCKRCGGTGAIDAPFSGSDPMCPDCDGEGEIWKPHPG